jgi:hypothetical protein
MHWLRWVRQRRAWKRAQRLHAYEHAAKIETTLPCKAVGHMERIDSYSNFFDSDERRKFELAVGGKW